MRQLALQGYSFTGVTFFPGFGPEAQLQHVNSKGCVHEAGL